MFKYYAVVYFNNGDQRDLNPTGYTTGAEARAAIVNAIRSATAEPTKPFIVDFDLKASCHTCGGGGRMVNPEHFYLPRDLTGIYDDVEFIASCIYCNGTGTISIVLKQTERG